MSPVFVSSLWTVMKTLLWWPCPTLSPSWGGGPSARRHTTCPTGKPCSGQRATQQVWLKPLISRSDPSHVTRARGQQSVIGRALMISLAHLLNLHFERFCWKWSPIESWRMFLCRNPFNGKQFLSSESNESFRDHNVQNPHLWFGDF